MSFADSMQRCWYSPGTAPPWWTLPLASFYGAVVRLRRRLYRGGILRSQRLPVPVIVVGNITVGGAGKTPLVIALVMALRERGWKPGVVSRGYGGSAGGPLLLGPLPDPEQVGDEPALIASRTGAPIAVGVDRPAAARLLVGEGLDVIVADDGLQHYALVRDVEICVLDGVRRLGNGKLLPAGPLREPASRLGEVDFIVCNGREPQPGETPMSLVADTSVSLIDRSIRKPLVMFSQSRVHAIAGIGHPQRFFDSLREYGIDVIEHPFSDHHRYTPDDLAFDGDLPILMTEKDAVKCRAFAKPDWWSVPVAAALPESFFDAITQRLRHVASRSAAPSGL